MKRNIQLQGFGGFVLLLLVIATFLAGVIGWVWNIVKLFGLTTEQLGELVLRVIGVFLPFVGAIAGWL